MTSYNGCCCDCYKEPSAYITFNVPTEMPEPGHHFANLRGYPYGLHLLHHGSNNTGIDSSLYLDLYKEYLFWTTEHTPWCLLDEDIIHPKVKAEDYQISNEFVDDETGLVRVGFECVIDFQWNLYDVDIACGNKNEIGRYDLTSYCDVHPERGAVQENCIRSCTSPQNVDALFNTLDCNANSDCDDYQELLDSEKPNYDYFFPEFNGGCLYDPPDCYDLPFLKFNTTNHDVCGGMPDLSKPGENIDTLTETVNEVYDSLIERFGPQRLENGEMNPYPHNIIFISGVREDGRELSMYYWDSWNDAGYTGYKDCHGYTGEYGRSIIPMLDTRITSEMIDGPIDNEDPRGLGRWIGNNVSGTLGEHEFYYKLKEKFIENWGEEITNYKFNACPTDNGEENCFGHSCLETYGGGESGCYSTITDPSDPVPQNVDKNQFFYQNNHWPYFDIDQPGQHPGNPWREWYCEGDDCGPWDHTCARGWPWGNISYRYMSYDAGKNFHDPCHTPLPWVNPHTWELEAAPKNFRENTVGVQASGDNVFEPYYSATTRHMRNFTEIFKTKYRQPCYHANIVQDEEKHICPCDEDKLYQANSFFIEKKSPVFFQYSEPYEDFQFNCEEENLRLFIGGTGPNDFVGHIIDDTLPNPELQNQLIVTYCTGNAMGPIPANELGDDFRLDYTAYGIGILWWSDPLRGTSFPFRSEIVTLPLVCNQTGFPEYILPTRYRNVYTQPGVCFCGSSCQSDDNPTSCCENDDSAWEWYPDYLNDLYDSCQTPFFGLQHVGWVEHNWRGSGLPGVMGHQSHLWEWIGNLHHCAHKYGDSITAHYPLVEFWWEPGMDLASGNYPLTPQDFASFDQCGRWHSAAHPPYSLDEDVGQEENCGDLACWYSTGDDAFYGDLYFDVCGCCDPTHINTDLSENCSYF